MGIVVEQGEKIVAFAIFKINRDEVFLHNCAVDPDFRRMGVGSQMVTWFIAKLSPCKRTKITLLIRETNLPAQLFFKDRSFRAVKVLREHYEDTGEDAFTMEYQLQSVWVSEKIEDRMRFSR